MQEPPGPFSEIVGLEILICLRPSLGDASPRRGQGFSFLGPNGYSEAQGRQEQKQKDLLEPQGCCRRPGTQVSHLSCAQALQTRAEDLPALYFHFLGASLMSWREAFLL